MEPFIVTKAEAGQKLLNFLERRVENPQSDLHKWIRTGQVRRNGGRVKPFDRVDEGDAVRVPPFAAARRENKGEDKASATPWHASAHRAIPKGGPAFPPTEPACLGMPVVFEDSDILVLNKPAGLPTQGGTGHTDSVAARLARCYGQADFVPAPAHRLDIETSGLLVAGKTYAALRGLTDALAGRAGEAPHKDYLAWVRGIWPQSEDCELRDRIKKDDKTGRMRTLSSAAQDQGKEARCLARPLETRSVDGQTATLLLVRLLTGRTHQIRVQLASRGCPVVGDSRYAQCDAETGLKLHAYRLVIPPLSGKKSVFFLCPPPWRFPWRPANLPEHAEACVPAPNHD